MKKALDRLAAVTDDRLTRNVLIQLHRAFHGRIIRQLSPVGDPDAVRAALALLEQHDLVYVLGERYPIWYARRGRALRALDRQRALDTQQA